MLKMALDHSIFYSIEVSMSHLNITANKSTSKIVLSILQRFAGYYDGNLYRFVLENNNLILAPSDSDFTPTLLIVSPNYYQEQQISFPIDDKKELKKLLKLQLADNEVPLIQKQEEGKSEVNTWIFEKSVPEALIRVPESLLIGSHCENGDVFRVTDSENQATFITRFDGLIYSSAVKGMISNTERFAMSTGLSLEKNILIEYGEKAVAIANALSVSLLGDFLSFIKKPKTEDAKSLLIQAVTPILSVITIYLLVSSAYISIKLSSAENKLAQQAQQVTELLEIQNSLIDDQDKYQQLTKFLNNRTNVSGLWVVIAPIFKTATIKNITIQDDKFLIRGQTKSATLLLDTLTNNPNVLTAKFETPVRKNRNIEQFNLSFKLKKTLVIPEQSLVPDNE